MTRRITVPDDHVAVLFSSQLADELSSLIMTERNKLLQRCRNLRSKIGGVDTSSNLHTDQLRAIAEAQVLAGIYGDVMLALLEAKEA